jgi:hypothetical protein
VQVLPAAQAQRGRFGRHRVPSTVGDQSSTARALRRGILVDQAVVGAVAAGALACGAATKVSPIRFCWIQAIWHSRTIEGSLAITKRKRCGTKAGSLTSMAQPSGEMLSTVQRITDPPDDTKAGSLISVLGNLRRSSIPIDPRDSIGRP